MFLTWRRCAGAVSAVVVLAAGLALGSGAGVSAQPGLAGEVAVRDRLIADQENLLNAYRCMFGVDTEVVPGGCPDPDTVSPGAAPPNPTQQDVEARDALIASQEELLNVYRCRYGIDTQLVPEGCPEPEDQPTPEATPEVTTEPQNWYEYIQLHYGDSEPEDWKDNYLATTGVSWNGYVNLIRESVEAMEFYSGTGCVHEQWCYIEGEGFRVIDSYYRVCPEHNLLSSSNDRDGNTARDYLGYWTILSCHLVPENYGILSCGLNYTTQVITGVNNFPYYGPEWGACSSGYSVWSWQFNPAWEVEFPDGSTHLCNARDGYLQRLSDVCVHPDTPFEDLEAWQYRAGSPADEMIRPFLHYDISISLREFCRENATELLAGEERGDYGQTKYFCQNSYPQWRDWAVDS